MTRPMKTVATSEDHEQFRLELIEVCKRRTQNMPADEVLAVVSFLVGQLVALQDQRRFTPDEAMAIVSSNLEMGNREALADLMKSQGGNA